MVVQCQSHETEGAIKINLYNEKENTYISTLFFLYFLKDCIYFRQRGREGEREGEKYQCE